VQQLSSSTSLSSSSNPSALGQPVTFTAQVSSPAGGTPTGTVSFYDGTTLLPTVVLTPGPGGPQATFTTATLASGLHTINAVYSGDPLFAPSTSNPLTQTVFSS
jgi:hypothetical protein